MASGKRFYWLRLVKDFFTSKRIKKLRKLAGGDTFTIIYLKLLLLAMESDGILRWTGLESDFAAEIALDIDEDTENVKVTMAYLLSCGLAESSDKVNFLFPYAVENTGSEGSSAQRMREARAAIAAAEKGALETGKEPCAHDSAQNGTMCAHSDGDIEEEIKEDIEKENRINAAQAATKDLFSVFAGTDEPLLKTLKDFEKMRNRLKKPLSDRAKSMLLSKLQLFPRDQWIPILEQSIFHCWQGIFPLKEDAAQRREQPRKSHKAQELDDFYDMAAKWARQGDGK